MRSNLRRDSTRIPTRQSVPEFKAHPRVPRGAIYAEIRGAPAQQSVPRFSVRAATAGQGQVSASVSAGPACSAMWPWVTPSWTTVPTCSRQWTPRSACVPWTADSGSSGVHKKKKGDTRRCRPCLDGIEVTTRRSPRQRPSEPGGERRRSRRRCPRRSRASRARRSRGPRFPLPR